VKRNRSQVKRTKTFQKLRENRLRFSLVSFCIAFLFFAAGGCGGSPPPSSPSSKGPPPAIAKKGGDLTKVAEKKELEKKEEKEYSYDPAGKADPFKPFIQLTPAKVATRTLPLTPLQKYEISQLKLGAIIASAEGNVALVEDSAGKGYFLKKETGIGKNEGKVKKILKDRVVIEEVYEDAFGQKKLNEISLYLHQVEEGGDS
jgi:type IV pilus assembly protein PilP